MQTNPEKSMTIILAATLIAAFFMPWLKFFVGVSAWDIVFGSAGDLMNLPWRYIAVIIPITGLIIVYCAAFNNENYPLPKTFLAFLPGIVFFLMIVFTGAYLSDNRIKVDDSFTKIIGIGLWLTAISCFLLPIFLKGLGTSSGKITPQIKIQQEKREENLVSDTSTIKTVYKTPQVNINLPKVDWNKTAVSSKKFLSKYKVFLIISICVLIAFIIVYNLFLKPDPVKDAKILAQNYCGCQDELNKNNLATMQSFLKDFDSKNFKSRMDARNSLNNLLQPNETKYNNCVQQANMKYKEKDADYNAKGGRNYSVFEQTYNSIIGACNSNNNDIATIQYSIDERIKSITDPEPDIDKIKSDLIGQQIPGWKFAYLNEFKSANIINSTKSNDRMEYQVHFDLTDNQTNDEHDCEVMIVYIQSDYGWNLNGVTMNYITYTNTLFPDKYIQITPLSNCKWTAENLYNISWKTSDFMFAGETVTGPDKGAVTLPYSTVYYLKSLENHEIKVKFTYRPNN